MNSVWFDAQVSRVDKNTSTRYERAQPLSHPLAAAEMVEDP